MTTIECEISGSLANGTPSGTWAAARLLGRPRRSVGMYGDWIVAQIPWDALAAEWDLTRAFRVRFGESGTLVTLGGYYLRQRRQVEWGIDPLDGVTTRFFAHELRLVTLPGVMRDGRGGTLTEGTLNPLGTDGAVNTGAANYRTTQQLVDLCLDAIGVAHDAAPAALDTPVDGSTVVDAPGPLDWGMTRALPELEAILARVGWSCTLVNDGSKLTVHRLRRAGETITLPAEITNHAEPYSLEISNGVRADRVVVTSGRTRSTIITDRTLGGARPLEWVAFDTRGGAWLNNAQWIAAYPTEYGPGDIVAFRLGPGGVERTPGRMREFAHLFSAVRLHVNDRPANTRFVVPGGTIDAGFTDLGASAAVALARVALDQGNGLFLNAPVGAGDAPLRFDGVRAVAGEGVFVLPSDVAFVRMASRVGAHADAQALSGDHLRLVFAHEAETGDHLVDYFAAGYKTAFVGGLVTAVTMSSGELADALADPHAVKIEAPFLRRVLLWPEGAGSPTYVNDADLLDIAKQIALTRLGGAALSSGVIELAGMHAIEPGAVDGAVTTVEWDFSGGVFRTYVAINLHETPESWYDAAEAAARRSIGGGAGRHSLAGSSAGAGDARAGSTPGDSTVGAAGAHAVGAPEALPALRGRESAATGRRALDEPAPSVEIPRRDASSLWVEILDYTPISANRWKYGWREVKPSGNGWTSVVGGRDYISSGYAYNTIERPNDGVGLEGNSTDMGYLLVTMTLRPVAPGIVIRLYGPYDDGAGVNVNWFAYENANDGPCPEVPP